MTTVATKVPFADASPAEIREAIVPEGRDQFDASLRRALDAVASTLSLEPLEHFLAHWRRLAWSQADMGHDAWREMLAKADRILAGGQPDPGSRPWEEVKAELGLDNPDGEVRQWLFGPAGAGMLTYLIVDHDREVHVLRMHWGG